MAATKTLTKSDGTKIAPILGQKYLFIGMGEPFVCNCGRSLHKGMLSRYENESYCSERCVKKAANYES